MNKLRNVTEIKAEFKKLRRSYHIVTCGELRDIFRRYGDKQIYLIDSKGNEVPGAFYRIHDFLYSYRWELHPLSYNGISAKIESIGSVKGPCNSDDVKYLSKEAFNQWGGYYDVPVYVCETAEGASPQIPAFSEYTICGDRVIFHRSTQAYIEYSALIREWHESRKIESTNEIQEISHKQNTCDIKMPSVRRTFPKLFSDMLVGIGPGDNYTTSACQRDIKNIDDVNTI